MSECDLRIINTITKEKSSNIFLTVLILAITYCVACAVLPLCLHRLDKLTDSGLATIKDRTQPVSKGSTSSAFFLGGGGGGGGVGPK